MSLALSFVPLLAAAQFGTVTLTVNDATDVAVSSSSCGTTLTGRWAVALGFGVCSNMQLWVTDGECADAPVTGDLVFSEIAQAALTANRMSTGTVMFSVSQLPYFTRASADAGMGCGITGVDVTHKWCAGLKMASDISCFSPQVLRAATPVTIRYDTLAPGVPQIASAEALDSSAAVGVTVDSDTTTYRIEWRSSTDTGFSQSKTVASTSLNTTIDGLVNGTTYQVRVIAIDGSGNESAPSTESSVTPRASQGFWAACRDAGCPSQTGCSTTSGLPLVALLLLVRRVSARRRDARRLKR